MNGISGCRRKKYAGRVTELPTTTAMSTVSDSIAPPTIPIEQETKKEQKPNPWREHVAEFRRTHPDLKFKEVLQQAKLTYQKKGTTVAP